MVTEKKLRDFLKDLYTAGDEARKSLDETYKELLAELNVSYAKLLNLPKVTLTGYPPESRKALRYVGARGDKDTSLSVWYNNKLNEKFEPNEHQDHREEITNQIYAKTKPLAIKLLKCATTWKAKARRALPDLNLDCEFNFTVGNDQGQISMDQLIGLCFLVYTITQEIDVLNTLFKQGYHSEQYYKHAYLEELKNTSNQLEIISSIKEAQPQAFENDAYQNEPPQKRRKLN